MYANMHTQIKHRYYAKMPRLAQISKIGDRVSTSEFLLTHRLLDFFDSISIGCCFSVTEEDLFKKSIQNMDFSKLFLMDLHLREQYKSRHASITCMQFCKTYSHHWKSQYESLIWAKFDRYETAKTKNIKKKAVISKSVFSMIWVFRHSLKYTDSGLLLLLTQVTISYRTSQISIIKSLITKGLFAHELLHDYGFLKQAWLLLYCF